MHSALKWENIVVAHYLKNIQSLAMYTREFKECPLLKKIQNADYNSLSDSGN